MNRTEILEKLANGEITVDEATRLLHELNAAAQESAPEAEQTAEPAPEPGEKPQRAAKPRWLKIRVGNAARDHVRINIPFGLINAGMLLGARLTDRISGEAWQEVMDAVERGEIGTLVEVEDEDDGERVHIYVE